MNKPLEVFGWFMIWSLVSLDDLNIYLRWCFAITQSVIHSTDQIYYSQRKLYSSPNTVHKGLILYNNNAKICISTNIGSCFMTSCTFYTECDSDESQNKKLLPQKDSLSKMIPHYVCRTKNGGVIRSKMLMLESLSLYGVCISWL